MPQPRLRLTRLQRLQRLPVRYHYGASTSVQMEGCNVSSATHQLISNQHTITTNTTTALTALRRLIRRLHLGPDVGHRGVDASARDVLHLVGSGKGAIESRRSGQVRGSTSEHVCGVRGGGTRGGGEGCLGCASVVGVRVGAAANLRLYDSTTPRIDYSTNPLSFTCPALRSRYYSTDLRIYESTHLLIV
jgi:hypothetical protein